MFCTNTHTIENQEIASYHGIVQVVGVMQIKFDEIFNDSQEHLQKKATELGCDAVISVSIGFISIANRPHFLMSGTAVKFKQ